MDELFEVDPGTRVVTLAPGPETDALIGFFERAAAELSWQPGAQLRAYRDAARHLAIMVGEEIVGGLQVVAGAGDALPFRAVWPEISTGETRAAHVTVMALERKHRGPGLFWPLCVELWRWCDASGIETILMEATPPTLRVYRRLGWPLEVIGDLRTHWGEECYLCRAGVRKVEEAIVGRARRSDAYRALVAQGHRDRR